MNYAIITACYEFIYMYRDPWRTGTWSRTDTLPGQPGRPGCRLDRDWHQASDTCPGP